MSKREKLDQSGLPREKKVKRVKTDPDRPSLLPMTPVDVDCFLLEEEESYKQSREECFLAFKETCKELRDTFQSVYMAKRNKTNEAEISHHRAEVCMQIMNLKKLNRLDKHRCKRSRDAVNEGKQNVDNLNLQYQNLLYEETHLKKEVTKCLEFRSQDEEIELVSIEDFYKEAPHEISRPEITKQDNHEMTIARLQWELEQRKRFALKLKEAEVTKCENKQKIRKIKECLDSIQPTLSSILEATEPLQSKLGMPLQATQRKHKTAKFLPKPLYLLYLESCAYREALDKKIHISIDGSIDEAKVLQLKTEEIISDSGDSEQEESSNVKRHRHSVSVRRVDASKDILNKHPLSVCLTVSGGEARLYVEFFYLFHLKIVTVSVKTLLPQRPSSPLIGDLLKLDTFLNCLFPEDNGKESPNLANKYQLQKLKYDESPFSNDKTGWPYIWVQRLAGLEFTSSSASNLPNKISFSSMEVTVQAIRSRLLARIALCNQILSLEQGTSVPLEIAHTYPSNIVSQLKKWSPVLWEEVMEHPKYSEMLESNIITKDSSVFKAVIKRGSATLSSLVILLPDYPTRSPLFLLFLQWKTSSTSATNVALRELEEEVNIQCVEMLPEEHLSNILVCQMQHLLVCFDVFLETEDSGEPIEGPREFFREKMFTRIARGRSHSHPYKYISSNGIFTHR